MNEQTHPTFANGKICYIVIPAGNIEISAAFYEKVFGWNTRKNKEGDISFDDGAGEVSGTWVTGCDPFTDEGLQIHIMVDNMETSIKLIRDNGGIIVQSPGSDIPEITARFADPYGNIFGLYQHRR
jgi:predicted enzyme related to lactoylglutathione lyase